MIDGTYKVSAETPIGKKSGTVTLKTGGTAVHAVLKAGLLGKYESDGQAQGNTFTFSGTAKVPLAGTANYVLEGAVEGNVLTAVVKAGRHSIRITGTRA